jgi:folate-dependent phosphoribosylglycinamide formyltransferase PurN
MLSDTLHVGVLCSKRAPGLEAFLRHPFRHALYEVECVITTEMSFPECDVPVVTHPIRSFYDEQRAPLRDWSVRELYDLETREVLRRLGVDTVVLLGYLYVVTDPLLAAFPERVINLHDGLSKYPGLHATRDAILAGERETRSIAHLVTARIDAGPIVARSRPFPVAPFVRDAVASGEYDIVRAYAYAHREWMMRSVWSDLLVHALEEVVAGAGVVT